MYVTITMHCAPHVDLVKMLKDQYKEVALVGGIANPSHKQFLLFGNKESGTFTFMSRISNDLSCYWLTGTDLQMIPVLEGDPL